jgi:hypothetical protein
MQAFTHQQLVHLLELAQREHGREKAEGHGGLIEPALDGSGSGFDHRTLPR